jgi:membrane-associated phospholipid phosphatase
MSVLTSLDDRAFLAVNDFARDTPWLHGPAVDFAKYGVVLFGLAIVAAVVYSRWHEARTTAAAVWAGIGTMVAVAVNQPIGNAVGEHRPYTVYPHALLLVDKTTDFSFPSDHAVMAGAVAMGLFLVSRRLGLVALLAALLMAFTRVYVGAHYPQDVVAGLLLGAAVVAIGWLLVASPLTSAVGALRETRLSPVLVADQPVAAAAARPARRPENRQPPRNVPSRDR